MVFSPATYSSLPGWMMPPWDDATRGVLEARPAFERLTRSSVAWSGGTSWAADAVIWCTGFRPALGHLRALGLSGRAGHPRTGGGAGAQAVDEPRLP